MIKMNYKTIEPIKTQLESGISDREMWHERGAPERAREYIEYAIDKINDPSFFCNTESNLRLVKDYIDVSIDTLNSYMSTIENPVFYSDSIRFFKDANRTLVDLMENDEVGV